jgi:hypothetical protein
MSKLEACVYWKPTAIKQNNNDPEFPLLNTIGHYATSTGEIIKLLPLSRKKKHRSFIESNVNL